jgi:curved DNA-binding protein CbpA
MKGNLIQLCPAEVLSEILHRQASGALSFSHADVSRQLFIDAGLAIRFAASNHPAESFTAQVVHRARLDEAQMRAATAAKGQDELLGTVLVRLGYLKAADFLALAREHVRRVVRAALTMSEGTWSFQTGALPFREQLDTGMRTTEALLEWSRTLTDPAWTRRRLGPGDTRVERHKRPPDAWQSIRLDPAEGYIMSRVDGNVTLHEIGLVSPMGDQRTFAALLGLTLAGILELPDAAAGSEGGPMGFAPDLGTPAPAPPVSPAPTARPQTTAAPPAPRPAASAPPVVPASARPAAATPTSSSHAPRGAVASAVPGTPAAKQAAPAAAPGAPATPAGGNAPATPLRLAPTEPPGSNPATKAGGVGPRMPHAGAGTPARPAGPGRPPGARPGVGAQRPKAPATRPAVPAPTPAQSAAELESEMLRRFSQLDHQDLYQVLGIPSSAGVDDVRRAYYALARRFHPDKLRREDLKPRAEKVFARITEAYATLSDSEARQRYDAEEAGKQVRDDGAADTTDLARENFRTGREHLEHGHLAEALGFLTNACQQDPTKAEYFVLLGITQGKNPRLRREAEASLLKAIAIAPANAEAYAQLGALYERAGAADRAREMYRKALEWDPENKTAGKALEPEEPGRKGLFGLFSRR